MRIAALEIAGDTVRGAVAERRLGRTRLLHAAHWPIADEARTAGFLRGARAVRLAVPLHAATHRWLTLPFRSAGQLAATVPLELLAQLPSEPADAMIGWRRGARAAGGSVVLAAIVRGATLARLGAAAHLPAEVEPWLGPLAAWTLVPASLGDVALVIADGARSSVGVRRAGGIVALRGLDVAPSATGAFVDDAGRTLAALSAGDLPLLLGGTDAAPALCDAFAARGPRAVRRLDGDDVGPVVIGLALAGEADGLRFDDPQRPRVAGVSRRTVGLAAAAALAACIDLGLYQRRLVAEDLALQDAIAAEASAALPGVALVAPRAQLEAALHDAGDARFAAPVLDTLREASARLPADVRLEVDQLVVDGASFRLHGRTDSYEHVDALRRALAGARAFTDVRSDDTHAGIDAGTVEFTLQATRRSAPGASS